jgi:hypothetical protein
MTRLRSAAGLPYNLTESMSLLCNRPYLMQSSCCYRFVFPHQGLLGRLQVLWLYWM